MSDAALDAVVAAAVQELRRPVALDASLDTRVMAAIARAPALDNPLRTGEFAATTGRHRVVPGALGVPARPTARAAWRWLRRPRTVHVSPLAGLAVAAGLAAVIVLGTLYDEAGSATGQPSLVSAPAVGTPPPAVDDTLHAPRSPLPAPSQFVQFVLVAPEARQVALVGDFNDWAVGATPLRPVADGRVWSVEVPLLAGRHRYAFVIDDGEWVADPTAPRAPGGDFGTPSSVVTVAERRS